MTVKIKKRESARSKKNKLAKATAKSKNINWDKYFGKINFPIEALSYQKKVRDEWSQ